MVRIVVLCLFVLALAASPVVAFDRLVLPELFSLKQVYGNAEATAQRIANDAQ